jgi:hypothetical protein
VPQVTNLARAQEITREWQQRFPDETAWLRLMPGAAPAPRAHRRRRARRLRRALRELIAAWRS